MGRDPGGFKALTEERRALHEQGWSDGFARLEPVLRDTGGARA